MVRDRGRTIEFRDDTAINVVGLLKAGFGDHRTYPLVLAGFVIDGAWVAKDVAGEVRLTRLRDAIIGDVRAGGRVELECARCLRPYDQPFVVDFSEEFRQSVDVRTGIGLAPADDEDEDEEISFIDQNHELDVGDVLRQEIVLALPMRPTCGDACPGPEVLVREERLATGLSEEAGDDRFAALEQLLRAGDDDSGLEARRPIT